MLKVIDFRNIDQYLAKINPHATIKLMDSTVDIRNALECTEYNQELIINALASLDEFNIRDFIITNWITPISIFGILGNERVFRILRLIVCISNNNPLYFEDKTNNDAINLIYGWINTPSGQEDNIIETVYPFEASNRPVILNTITAHNKFLAYLDHHPMPEHTVGSSKKQVAWALHGLTNVDVALPINEVIHRLYVLYSNENTIPTLHVLATRLVDVYHVTINETMKMTCDYYLTIIFSFFKYNKDLKTVSIEDFGDLIEQARVNGFEVVSCN